MSKIDYSTILKYLTDLEEQNRKNTRLARVLNQGYLIDLIFQSDPNISYKRISDEWFSGAMPKQQVWKIYDEYLKEIKKIKK